MPNQTFLFLRKICLHENEIYKVQVYNAHVQAQAHLPYKFFQIFKNHQVVFFVKCVNHTHAALLRSNANFFLQTQENNQDEDRETGCFQSKINYVNTKTRAKTKYQISGGQNSYSSSVPLLDQKFESSLLIAESQIFYVSAHLNMLSDI